MGKRDKNGRNSRRRLSLLTGKVNQYKITGLSGCGCDTGFHAGVVLDPFMGAGTTAITARALNRHFLGIDLNPDYVAMF